MFLIRERKWPSQPMKYIMLVTGSNTVWWSMLNVVEWEAKAT